MGEVKQALPHLEEGMVLYDQQHHGSIGSLYGGHDPGACCRYYLAFSQWGLGYPERALIAAREAMRLAETLGHAMTSTMTLGFVASVLHLRGDRQAVIDAGRRGMAIIDAHGFRGRAGSIAALLYAARSDRPEAATLDTLQRERTLDSGTWLYLLSGCTVASLYGKAGAPEKGLQVLAAMNAEEKAGSYASEVHRVEGELRRHLTPTAPGDAARCFHLAIDLARRRELKSLELRAATSLARLWRDQGRREEAHRAFAEVYGWFTEGFDTHDLRQAKALLERDRVVERSSAAILSARPPDPSA